MSRKDTKSPGRTGGAGDESKTSAEFNRFESLTKRLLAVPKKAINGQGERQKAKKSRG